MPFDVGGSTAEEMFAGNRMRLVAHNTRSHNYGLKLR